MAAAAAAVQDIIRLAPALLLHVPRQFKRRKLVRWCAVFAVSRHGVFSGSFVVWVIQLHLEQQVSTEVLEEAQMGCEVPKPNNTSRCAKKTTKRRRSFLDWRGPVQGGF
eukprot:TRINITY_DN2397_c0_g1_i1.p3 TRINITY_DN2397_c0_g1~~TRINITY_DN2397_c0_g1_i1.p3  ORF type:complete len:109 (+),score=24.25 TRINITY_DN2397_c0_g1_i1:364-690(+)